MNTEKLETPQVVSSSQIRKRLIKSIISGVVFFSLVAFAFVKIQNAPEKDEISNVLRKALRFDESVGSTLHSNARLAPPLPKPKPGTPPRFNGDVGITTPVDLKNYLVEVNSGDQTLKLPCGFSNSG